MRGEKMGQKVVILVRQDGLGDVRAEDRRFGREMFDRFLHALESQPVKPEAICFYTEGVRLACEGSLVVPGLKLIQGMGTRVVICTSCLEHYGLKEKLAVGEARGMNEIVRLLMDADKVITA